MDGDFDSAFAHVEFGGDLLIRFSRRISSEVIAEFVEQVAFSRSGALGLKAVHDAFEESQGPATMKGFFRSHLVIGRKSFTLFGLQLVPGKDHLLAAAFEGVRLVPLVIEKMLEGDQEKGPEAALGGSNCLQGAMLEKMCEERLGQILRLGDGMASAPDEGVERRPINLTEPQKGVFAALTSLQNNGPRSGAESRDFAGRTFRWPRRKHGYPEHKAKEGNRNFGMAEFGMAGN